MHCDRCGKRAPDELIEMAGENYGGDYFCSEECSISQSDEDDKFR